MRILIFEDDAIKYSDVCKVIKATTDADITWVLNMEDGIETYKNALDEGKAFDCIITDMWYPQTSGGMETNSGEELIDYAQSKNWTAPIILCSSVNYSYPGIKGSVHYAANEDWEERLSFLINRVLTAMNK